MSKYFDEGAVPLVSSALLDALVVSFPDCPLAFQKVMTPLHSGKSGLSVKSGTTSIVPAQYMREEMLTPSPPPNWGQSFTAQHESNRGAIEFKDEVRSRFALC